MAMAAPKTASTAHTARLMGIPNSGKPQSIITTAVEPTMIPVASRGSFRAMVNNSITTSAVKGIHRAAKTVANAKSKG